VSKLFSILLCLVFTLGILVASMAEINKAVMKKDGLREKSVSWIDKAIPSTN
jgi:hypothetical protein